MKFPDSVFGRVPRFHDKLRVNIRRIVKTFDPYRGVATTMVEIVDYKKWRSTWLAIYPDKQSWYIIERYYCKLHKKTIPFE